MFGVGPGDTAVSRVLLLYHGGDARELTPVIEQGKQICGACPSPWS
jgi:hypothetical protein